MESKYIPSNRRRDTPPEVIREVCRLYDTGMTYRGIARELPVSKSKVETIVSRLRKYREQYGRDPVWALPVDRCGRVIVPETKRPEVSQVSPASLPREMSLREWVARHERRKSAREAARSGRGPAPVNGEPAVWFFELLSFQADTSLTR